MDDYDFLPSQNRLRLAQSLMQAQPVRSGWDVLANAVRQNRAENLMRESESLARGVRDQREYDEGVGRQKMADLATLRPRAGVQPVTPNDDEGNPMPTGAETPEAFQERRVQLARAMLASTSPEARQFAMSTLMPSKKEILTLKPGENAFERDQSGALKKIGGGGIDTSHFAPKDYSPDSYSKFLQTQNPADLRKAISADDLIIMGPDGKPTVNQAAIDAKVKIARAGQQPPAAQLVETENGYQWVAPPQKGYSGPATAPSGQQLRKAPKELTDAQAKANLFGTRASQSNATLGSLAKNGVTQPSLVKRAAEAIPLLGAPVAMAANAMASPEQQQVEQAQRDFINAVLRRESGAVISPGEFTNAQQQYFPQPGDSPQVMAQKEANRKTAIQGILAEVPESRRMASPAVPAGWSIKPIQ
jgi:hypothetical protein